MREYRSMGVSEYRSIMEVAMGVEGAIGDEAMDMRIPGEEVAEGLNGGNKTGLKRFLWEDGTKELKDGFSST